MTQEKRPDPLVPPEVDLRGLEYMPLLGERLFSSDFDLEASDAEFRAGLRLWWRAWNQQPAASLPNNEKMLCKLAGFDDNVAKWRKLRDRALHGFVVCSDGRLYHPVLADQALIAWEKRAEDRAKRDNEADRKRRERIERSRMFEQLRAVGVTPAWNTHTADLRTLVTQHVTRTGPEDVTRTGGEPVTRTGPPPVTVTGHGEPSAPVTRTGTAKTGRDGTGRDSTSPINNESGRGTSPAVALAVALRDAGVRNASGQNPDVLRWAADGVTVEQATEAARIAIHERKKAAPTTGYLAGIINDLRAGGAAAGAGPGPSSTARAVATLEGLKESSE